MFHPWLAVVAARQPQEQGLSRCGWVGHGSVLAMFYCRGRKTYRAGLQNREFDRSDRLTWTSGKT